VHLQWYAYPLAIVAGVLAGIINTLAGSGSLITLPMLIFLGLPANLANGTNRVGVAIQNVVGITTYRQGGRLDLSGTPWLLVPGILGAIAGARIAAELDAKAMNTAIGVVMLVMLGVILFDPKRWLRERSIVKPGRPGIGYMILFFGLGIYAGFIQAGIGILLLATMVLGLGYSLVDANGLKLVIVLAFTLTALVVFVVNGQVNWGMGALMAVGQSTGAWLAARFAIRNKNANVWVRRLLIAVVSVSIWKLFGLPPF
jgi:uncharacterized membrane protein YfcA